MAIRGFFKTLIGATCLGLVACSDPTTNVAPLETVDNASLEAALSSVRDDLGLVGVAGIVSQNGQTVAQTAIGDRRKGSDDPLSMDDLFHVGSIGKSMSSTVIARLVERGVMSWDDTIGDYLSDLEIPSSEEGARPTPIDPVWLDVPLHYLLTHQSGMPQPPFTLRLLTESDPEKLRDVRRRVGAEILAKPPVFEPGTDFAYSNEGYMIASLMAETATDTPWETLVKQELAEPLGLSTLGFGAPGMEAPETQPWGHRSVFGWKRAAEPGARADNPQWMAAAGTMHMSLTDLVRYGQAHLEEGRGETAILSPETFERLHTPGFDVYAFGWIIFEREGLGPVMWHNGSNTMWYAVLFIIPEKQAVIALATNDATQMEVTQSAFDQLGTKIGQALPVPARSPDETDVP